MKPYLDLLRHILDHGRVKADRTGTGTISVFGTQTRYDLTESFPAVTTKELFFGSVIHENLWFLLGGDNNQYLADRRVGIWKNWALAEDATQERILSLRERLQLWAPDRVKEVGWEAVRDELAIDLIPGCGETPDTDYLHEFLDDRNIPHHEKVVTHAKGALGPIYGAQWRRYPAGNYFYGMTRNELIAYVEDMATDQRKELENLVNAEFKGKTTFDQHWNSWIAADFSGDAAGALLAESSMRPIQRALSRIGIDQISVALGKLRREPDSRQNIVSAWNPAVIPGNVDPLTGEKIDATQNVIRGRQALPACHTMFQLYTTPLTVDERLAAFNAKMYRMEEHLLQLPESTVEQRAYRTITTVSLTGYWLAKKKLETVVVEDMHHAVLDELKAPSRRLDLHLYQRKHPCALAA